MLKAALLGMYHEVSGLFYGRFKSTPVSILILRLKKPIKKLGWVPVRVAVLMVKDSYRNLLISQEEDAELWKIVKAADKISAYLKCVEELKQVIKNLQLLLR